MFTSITRYPEQPMLPGDADVLETRAVSSWHRAKANLGTRWRT